MKRKWKTILIVLVVLTLGIGVYASTVYSKRGVVAVQTGKVVRQDLTSLVTASGEIKPKNYINIGANAIGMLTEILVKEGDQVAQGPTGGAGGEYPARGGCEFAESGGRARPRRIPTRPRPALKVARREPAHHAGHHRPRPGRSGARQAGLRSRRAAVQRSAPRQAGFRHQEGHLRRRRSGLAGAADAPGRRPSRSASRRRPNWHPRSAAWRRPTRRWRSTADMLQKYDSYRAARWRGDQSAGARRRNRGARRRRIRRAAPS